MKLKYKHLKILLLVYLLSQIAFYSFAPLYALFATDLNLDLKTIGFIWSGYSLAAAVCILLMGRLENKQKKGRMIVLGFLLFAASDVFLLTVQNQNELMIAFGISALASGITFPAYKTLFANSETKGRESEQWAWLDAGNMLSSAIGAAVGALVVAEFGFTGLFLGMAIVQFAAAGIAYKGLYFAK